MAKTKTLIVLSLLIVFACNCFAGMSVQSHTGILGGRISEQDVSIIYYDGTTTGDRLFVYPYIPNPYSKFSYVECSQAYSQTGDTIQTGITHLQNANRSMNLLTVYSLNSDILFTVDKIDTNDYALLSIDNGSLYIDGNLLAPQQDGKYLVPVNTQIQSLWSYSYHCPYTTIDPYLPTVTAAQTISPAQAI